MWKEVRGAPNVNFYQMNGEDMSLLESGSFDFVNFAYLLHEMPADNAKGVVDEMNRLLAPGGTIHG